MQGDILNGYVGKLVLIDVNPLARPRGARDIPEIYIGHLREYDGSFLKLSPFGYARGDGATDKRKLVEGLVEKLANLDGNREQEQPQVLNKGLVGKIKELVIRDQHPDE